MYWDLRNLCQVMPGKDVNAVKARQVRRATYALRCFFQTRYWPWLSAPFSRVTRKQLRLPPGKLSSDLPPRGNTNPSGAHC